MKRQILSLKRHIYGAGPLCGCCPGHDLFPSDTYKNQRSKKARSRDKKKEHRYARHVLRNDLTLSIDLTQE